MSALESAVRPGVVRIGEPGDGYDGRSTAFWGSGFFIAPGWVLTCAHVVGKGAGAVAVWRGEPAIGVTAADGERFTGALAHGLPAPREGAEPFRAWPFPDLALIRVPEAGDPDCLWLTDRSTLTPAEVGVYGWTRAPEEGQLFLAGTGMASGGTGGPLTLSGAALPPGCSGGPVVDLRLGAVIGVSKGAGRGSSDGGLAVPVTALRALWDEGRHGRALWHEVLRAHDRHHLRRYHSIGESWPRLQTRTHGGGYGFTPRERTELYALLAELPPPTSAGQVLEMVNDARRMVLQPSYRLDVPTPRSWREGPGLLYDPHDGHHMSADTTRDLELEAVTLYAAKVYAALAHQPVPAQRGAAYGPEYARQPGPVTETGSAAPAGPGTSTSTSSVNGLNNTVRRTPHDLVTATSDAAATAKEAPPAGSPLPGARTPAPAPDPAQARPRPGGPPVPPSAAAPVPPSGAAPGTPPAPAPEESAPGAPLALAALREWIENTAFSLQVEVVRELVADILGGDRQAHAAYADVLVEIDPDVYGTHAWRVKLLQEDGQVTPVRHNEVGVPREQLERDIRAALATALDEGDVGEHVAAVDFMLPRSLFDEPVDEWRARPPDPDDPNSPHTLPLGRRRFVALRDAARRRQGVTPEWRSRWQSAERGPLEAVPLRHEVPEHGHEAPFPEGDGAGYARLLQARPGSVPVHCAGTGTGRGAEAMLSALNAGHPVLLWRRCGEGHEDCAEFHERAGSLLREAGTARRIPDHVRSLRNRTADAAAPDPDAAWARHLVLLYDPPHGPPLPDGPLRVPPLRPGGRHDP